MATSNAVGTIVEEAGDKLSSGDPPDTQARKERKRVTDRVAQREHRRRQKLYVEELEAEVRLLKEQSRADEAGAALILENEKLRKELKTLRAFLDNIESLVNIQRKDSTLGNATAQTTPEQRREQPFVDDAQLGVGNADIGQLEAVNMTVQALNDGVVDACQIEDGNTTAVFSAIRDEEWYRTMPVADQSVVDVAAKPLSNNVHNLRDWWGIPHEEHNLAQITMTGTDTPTWLNNFLAIGSLSPSGQLNDLSNPLAPDMVDYQANLVNAVAKQRVQTDTDMHMTDIHTDHDAIWRTPRQTVLNERSSAPESSHSDLCPDAVSGGGSPDSSRTKFEVQIHRSLPHVLMPPLPRDIYVHEIIERARSNALSRQMLLDAPTLADFLVDNSTNVLSQDLKKFLEPVRKARRTTEYLGTYWICYLLLRWQVNQSEESFARIPPWFRPTDIQMHVPHPIAVDFVAWPRLRDELVKLSQRDPDMIHEVMTVIGIYLELSLETSSAQCLTNETVLDAAVCNLKNWRLKDGFYKIYPQWLGLCEPLDLAI